MKPVAHCQLGAGWFVLGLCQGVAAGGRVLRSAVDWPARHSPRAFRSAPGPSSPAWRTPRGNREPRGLLSHSAVDGWTGRARCGFERREEREVVLPYLPPLPNPRPHPVAQPVPPRSRGSLTSPASPLLREPGRLVPATTAAAAVERERVRRRTRRVRPSRLLHRTLAP